MIDAQETIHWKLLVDVREGTLELDINVLTFY